MKRTSSASSSDNRANSLNNSNEKWHQDEIVSNTIPIVRETIARISRIDLQGKSATRLTENAFEVPVGTMDTLKLTSGFISFQDLGNWMLTCKATYWAADQHFELRRAPKLTREVQQRLKSSRLGVDHLVADAVEDHGFYNTALLTPVSERTKAFLCFHAYFSVLHALLPEGGQYWNYKPLVITYLPRISKLSTNAFSTAVLDFFNSDFKENTIPLEIIAEPLLSFLQPRLHQMRTKDIEIITKTLAHAIKRDHNDSIQLQQEFLQEWAEKGTIEKLRFHLDCSHKETRISSTMS